MRNVRRIRFTSLRHMPLWLMPAAAAATLMGLTLSMWLSTTEPPQLTAEHPPTERPVAERPVVEASPTVSALAEPEPPADAYAQVGSPQAGSEQAPPLALIATTPDSGQSTLHIVKPGEKWPAPAVTFTHLPGASLRAAALSQSAAVMVTARNEERPDASFDMGLYRLDASGGTTLLCGDVIHASRPLVTPDDHVFVARGSAGSLPAEPGAMRVDLLHIDAIDPQQGTAQRIHDYEGYLVHLAGYHQGELLAYRVGPDHADVIAIDPQHAKTRVVLAEMPPFARDFSVDTHNGRLIYRQRHQSDRARWTVMALDIAAGARELLYEGERFSMAPHAWPDGGVAFNPRGDGLRLLDTNKRLTGFVDHGVDWVRAISQDGHHIAALHSRVSMPSVAFTIDRTSGIVRPIQAPPHRRIAVAGFVSAQDWDISAQGSDGSAQGSDVTAEVTP